VSSENSQFSSQLTQISRPLPIGEDIRSSLEEKDIGDIPSDLKTVATIRITYLPQNLGAVDGTLVIHTSRGQGFFYKMKAKGVPNPYGISPRVVIRVTTNFRYTEPIWPRNAHSNVALTIEQVNVQQAPGVHQDTIKILYAEDAGDIERVVVYRHRRT
jgi:hypothetical protein